MDNEVIDEEIFFALVMNGKSAGAFRKLSPYSEINDGLLDVLIFKKCPMYEIVPLLMQVWNGEHPKASAIHYSKTNKVHIECKNTLISDLDGETGPELPLDIEVIKGRLEIIK